MSLTSLLLLSIIAVTTFIPLVEEGYSQATANNQQTPSTKPIDCKSIASEIGSNAFPISNPHKEICDISIMRQSPEIKDQNGTVLNNFLAINSLVEIMGHSSTATTSTMSGTGSNNTTVNASSATLNRQNVMAMGEFALLQTELKPVLKILSKTNWTIVAIHNHAILENPKTIFVHWDAKGPVQSIVSPIKEVLVIQQQSAQQGNETGSGSQQQSANNSSENPLAEIGEKIGDVFTGGGEEKK